jgi:hypothetical protein
MFHIDITAGFSMTEIPYECRYAGAMNENGGSGMRYAYNLDHHKYYTEDYYGC